MCFAARNEDNGTDYGVVAKLNVLGGSARPEKDYVEISNAQSVLILIKTFTNGSRERRVGEFENAAYWRKGRIRQTA